MLYNEVLERLSRDEQEYMLRGNGVYDKFFKALCKEIEEKLKNIEFLSDKDMKL